MAGREYIAGKRASDHLQRLPDADVRDFTDFGPSLNCRSPLIVSHALTQSSALARSASSVDLFMRPIAKFIRVNA